MNYILYLLVGLSFSSFAQQSVSPASQPENSLIMPNSADTLRSQRKVFTTVVYQSDVKLRPGAVKSIMQEDTLAHRRYLTGRLLQPMGPLLSVLGAGLTIVALKGRRDSQEITVNRQKVTAYYTERSRAKLGAGLGLFIGGLILTEVANEFIGRSVTIFNGRTKEKQTMGLHLGVTPSGNLGFTARF